MEVTVMLSKRVLMWTAAMAMVVVGCESGPSSDAQCTAVPACEADETEVAKCDDTFAAGECKEVTVCGSTIACAATTDQCTAEPVCKDGDIEITGEDACGTDATCYKVEMCGATQWCQESEACRAIPTCDSGHVEYPAQDACPQDVECYQRTECDTTIWCGPEGAPCTEGNPCPDGQQLVTSQSDCLQDDAVCVEVQHCDETKYCTGPHEGDCTAVPVCDGDDMEVASQSDCLQDDAKCYEVTECGATIWCTGPDDNGCEAEPVCKEGEEEVDGPGSCLQDDAVCYDVTVCGKTIWCTGPDGPMPGPIHAILGGGMFSGFCFGACNRSVSLDGHKVDFKLTGNEAGAAPFAENTGNLTDKGKQTAQDIALALADKELDLTYGCPGCADGPIGAVTLLRNGTVTEHNYEGGNAPLVLTDADTFIGNLLTALETCTASDLVVPSASCELPKE